VSAGNGKLFEPDFVAIPYAVFVDPNLSHAAKLVLGRLRLYAGKDGRAFPKHETLASEVCLRDRQLRTVLSELQAAGWIEWRRARTNCVYTVFSDRQKTTTLNRQDRQKTASQSGGKLPITSAENRHSRVAENCQSGSAENCQSGGLKPNGCNAGVTRNPKSKRSIENHHQKEKSEKKSPETAVKGSVSGATPKEAPKAKTDSQRADDDGKPKLRTPLENPEMEFRARMAERHGPTVDGAALLGQVKGELGDIPLNEFLDADLTATTAPQKLTNPAGHYRKLARKLGRAAGVSVLETIAETSMAARKFLTSENAHRHNKPTCCNDGRMSGGGYCSCKTGAARRELDAMQNRAVSPAEISGPAPAAATRAVAR
jgi:hypothetical protein